VSIKTDSSTAHEMRLTELECVYRCIGVIVLNYCEIISLQIVNSS